MSIPEFKITPWNGQYAITRMEHSHTHGTAWTHIATFDTEQEAREEKKKWEQAARDAHDVLHP